MKTLLPEGWPRPKGYSNGIAAKGEMVFVAGQIGWTSDEVFEAKDFIGQFRQCLESTVAILAEANATPEHIVRMTWYITDRDEYLGALKEIGAIWRDVMGKCFPTMAVVIVAGLVEKEAKVEIETTAVLPDDA